MPVVLVPLHFDRDPVKHEPSCQRSIVIRTFITNDFMTGIPAEPGKHIKEEVNVLYLFKICKLKFVDIIEIVQRSPTS